MLPNKNKEQVYMKLSEGFPNSEGPMFTEKLEKFREIVQSKKHNLAVLETTFEQLRPEIVKLLKKKRRKNTKSCKRDTSSPNSSSSPNQSKGKKNLKLGLEFNSLNQQKNFFLTPPKENQTGGKSLELKMESEQMLGKRVFRCDLERELELFMPSKFFVVTNDFYKRKMLVKKSVN